MEWSEVHCDPAGEEWRGWLSLCDRAFGEYRFDLQCDYPVQDAQVSDWRPGSSELDWPICGHGNSLCKAYALVGSIELSSEPRDAATKVGKPERLLGMLMHPFQSIIALFSDGHESSSR